MNQRIEYIDIAKGFAIILVVIGHVLCYDLYGFDGSEKSSLYRFIYSFHMPLFFFLSGLVSRTDLKWWGMPNDLWKRFRSLIIPFFVVGGIFSLWTAGNFGFIFHSAKWGYWYLWVLFVLYAISYPVTKIGEGKIGLICQIVVILIIWYGLMKIVQYVPKRVNNTISLYWIYYFFPYFVLARLIKQNNLQKYMIGNHYVFVVALVLWMASRYYSFPFSEYIVACAAIVVVLNVCRMFERVKDSKIKGILIYLGKSSLYVYLFQYFFVGLFVTEYFKKWLLQYSNFGIDLILTIIPTILIVLGSLVVKCVIEREPFIMKYIFNRQEN